jgi:hypothetical protein
LEQSVAPKKHRFEMYAEMRNAVTVGDGISLIIIRPGRGRCPAGQLVIGWDLGRAAALSSVLYQYIP